MSSDKKNEIVFHNERYKDGQDSRSKFEKFYLVTIKSQQYKPSQSHIVSHSLVGLRFFIHSINLLGFSGSLKYIVCGTI